MHGPGRAGKPRRRRRAELVLSPFTRSVGAGHFEVRAPGTVQPGWSLWGPALVTLRSASGHFGVRYWPLWGPALATLGSGTGHFEVRFLNWIFFQVSDSDYFTGTSF